MSATQSPRILLAGCGALGTAIALRLSEFADVWGLRRHAELIPAPIHPLQADLGDRASLAAVLPDALDFAIYCVTPSQMDDAGYKRAYIDGLDNLLTLLESRPTPPRRVFFISSTGVYHQNDDEWIDEESPTEPARFSGQRLLEAEQRLKQSPIAGTSIRFSGIYGPDRTRFLRMVQEGRLAPRADSPFTNRIHEDDCAGILHHLVTTDWKGVGLADCYVGSDDEPCRLSDIITWIQSQADCAPGQPGAGDSARRAGSKRCDNARLKASGYHFLYPTYREGYRAIIDSGTLAAAPSPQGPSQSDPV